MTQGWESYTLMNILKGGLMLSLHRKLSFMAISLLVTSLACSLIQRVIVIDVEPEKTVVPKNIVNQPVATSNNPTPRTLLDCSVTQGLSKDPWVKFDDEFYWFLNIIEQDAKGRMWLATDGHGLLMYDGKEWHNWQPENRKDMSYEALRTMAVSETRVYAGAYGSSDGGNLLVYDIENDKWQTISPGEDAIRNNVIGGVAIRQTGEVYAMTKDGLDILDNGTWKYSSNPLNSDHILYSVEDALFDNEGNYWVAANNGIWKFDGKDWISYRSENGELPSNAVNALAIDEDGRIWAATISGLAVFSNGKWFAFSPSEFPWYQGWLDNVRIDSQNRVWVISRDVLSVYNGTEAILFTPDSIGEDLWNTATGFDQVGCVWVGMSLGLTIFQGKVDLSPGKYEFLK